MATKDSIASRLNQYDGITPLGDDPEALPPGFLPQDLWRTFARHGAKPRSTISAEASHAELEGWFCSAVSPLAESGECYISVASWGNLPWFRIGLDSGPRPLFALWKGLTNHELLVLSGDKTQVVGIIEEEYEYELHRRDIPSVGQS